MNVVVRSAMKGAGATHVALYRGSRGRLGGRVKGLPVLLLTVTGRKSGIARTTPVVYLADADSWIVSGSAGGAREEPQWFKNLRAASTARIEVTGTTTDVAVEVVEGDSHAQRWQQLTTAAPFFLGYQAKVERTIPIAVLRPAGSLYPDFAPP